MNNLDNKRIYFLDLLRVFAFTSVLIGHKLLNYLVKYSETNIHITIKLLINGLVPFFEYGGAGVVVFFLISGYIITSVIAKENTFEFLIKRFFRIYPLFIVAVLLEILLNFIVNNKPIPSIIDVIITCSLMGDFFNHPLALSGVEWTLRIEVLFYLLIALFKKTTVINKPNILLFIYLILVFILYKFGPFSDISKFNKGYITLYMPILFIGSAIFLHEKNKLNNYLFYFFVFFVLIKYYNYIPSISINTANSHFLIYGFLTFIILLRLNKILVPSNKIIFLSNLTYSIYLFHNWLWSYIYNIVSLYFSKLPIQNFFTLIVLFIFSIFTYKLIELNFIKIGKILTKLNLKYIFVKYKTLVNQ